MEITSSGSREVVLWANTNLPVVRIGVLDAAGREVDKGVFRPGQASVSLFLPPIQPFETADFTLLVRVAPENRTHPMPRVEPITIAILVIVGGATIVITWVGSKILRAGCDIVIKRNMKLAAAELTDEQINQMYNGIKQASNYAADWLKQVATGATENALKEYIKKYGSDFADLSKIAYDTAKGQHPIETLSRA